MTIYQDELPNSDGAGGGGGSEGELSVNIEEASAQIGADLGLGDDTDKGGAADPADGSASSPPAKGDVAPPDAVKAAADAKAATERSGKLAAAKAELAGKKVDIAGKTDDEILALAAPQVKAAPKAWKKELHESFSKLPAEVQDYIVQREAQVEEGFKANGEKVRYAEDINSVLAPYEAMLQAQGVKHHSVAVKTLMNAHYILSTEQPEGRAKFMAGLLSNYGVTLESLTAAVAARGDPANEETAAQKELRARMEKLENDRRTELQGRVDSLKESTRKEVEAFASDPKHPYFNEVAKEVTLLLQDPNMSLEAAYESAVWANPVTRAKESARIQKDAEAKAKNEAEAAAKAALKARGTKVRGAQEERESPDLLGSMEDTMRSTLRAIKDRQEG